MSLLQTSLGSSLPQNSSVSSGVSRSLRQASLTLFSVSRLTEYTGLGRIELNLEYMAME